MAIPSGSLLAPCAALLVFPFFAATAGAQTSTTTRATGAPMVNLETMSGEVVDVNGHNFVVRTTNGELRTFSNIPDSRRVIVDGREVGVDELRPGTRLTATIARFTTPVTTRTTTVGTGRVWVTAGNTVVLTLPNGGNRQYTVSPDFQFIVQGRTATVAELRPGMTVSAERIVEEPMVEIAARNTVVGREPATRPRAQTSVPTTPGR